MSNNDSSVTPVGSLVGWYYTGIEVTPDGKQVLTARGDIIDRISDGSYLVSFEGPGGTYYCRILADTDFKQGLLFPNKEVSEKFISVTAQPAEAVVPPAIAGPCGGGS